MKGVLLKTLLVAFVAGCISVWWNYGWPVGSFKESLGIPEGSNITLNGTTLPSGDAANLVYHFNRLLYSPEFVGDNPDVRVGIDTPDGTSRVLSVYLRDGFILDSGDWMQANYERMMGSPSRAFSLNGSTIRVIQNITPNERTATD